MSKLYVLVMAAGMARRFGRNKLLEPIAGQPLLLRHLNELTQIVKPQNILIVLGYQASKLITCLQSSPHHDIAYVVAEHYRQGLGHSIAAGVHALEHNSEALMITLADQWRLSAADYQHLIDGYLAHYCSQPARVHCAEYQQHRGVPAIFPSQYFSLLKELTGDQGARAWLGQLPEVHTTALPNAAWDLDRPDDLNLHRRNTRL